MREIVYIRRLLEPDALRRSAERIDSQTLAEAERVYRLMNGETDAVAWVDLDRQLHGIHFKAAESPRLTRILTTLLDACATYMVRAIVDHPNIAQKAQAGHAAVIDGLRRRDGDALQEIAIRHVETFLSA